MADSANNEYADRTTKMVLDYLNQQKEQPDYDLLRELNWSEQDLNEFLNRWNQARDLAVSPDEADRLKWEEKLKELGLQPPELRARSGANINDSFQQMRDAGGRTPPPERLRKDWEAFRRAMTRSR